MRRASILIASLAGSWLSAAPTWKAPKALPFGQLSVLELREDDPAAPALPRPVVEDTLGSLKLRAVEPEPDGHGWRFTVQPLQPGLAVIPPLDLGDGRRAPELRIAVARTTAYGSPWVGYGGGHEDILPEMPFPWAWLSLLALPLLAIAGFFAWRWRRGANTRAFAQAKKRFLAEWPPKRKDRAALDAAHAAGRDLLTVIFGDASRGWSAQELQRIRLEPWDQWVRSLDSARFGRTEPPFPPTPALLASIELEARKQRP